MLLVSRLGTLLLQSSIELLCSLIEVAAAKTVEEDSFLFGF